MLYVFVKGHVHKNKFGTIRLLGAIDGDLKLPFISFHSPFFFQYGWGRVRGGGGHGFVLGCCKRFRV